MPEEEAASVALREAISSEEEEGADVVEGVVKDWVQEEAGLATPMNSIFRSRCGPRVCMLISDNRSYSKATRSCATEVIC